MYQSSAAQLAPVPGAWPNATSFPIGPPAATQAAAAAAAEAAARSMVAIASQAALQTQPHPPRVARSPGNFFQRKDEVEAPDLRLRERPVLAEVNGERQRSARGPRANTALGKCGIDKDSTRSVEVVRQKSGFNNENAGSRQVDWGKPPPPVARAAPLGARAWGSPSYVPSFTPPTLTGLPDGRAASGRSPARLRVQPVMRVVSGEDFPGSRANLRPQSPMPGEPACRSVPDRRLGPHEGVNFSELIFLEELGSGEFGRVFRGLHKGAEVAIKQLYVDPSSAAPHAVLRDLEKEIGSFRHLRHKRLVGFIGACFESRTPCIVTEYAPGGSLHDFLHVRKHRLPVHHALNMCLQLAEVVGYLHGQNPPVVHRDLKSLNVVLDLQLNLKVCDFGLAESLDRTCAPSRSNGGSPRYMAPELFQRGAPITEKVDIWAMGCIFAELFGSGLPYEGIDTLDALMREMLVNGRSPAVPGNLDQGLQNILRSCFNFEQWRRPAAEHTFAQLRDVKHALRTRGVI